MDCKEIQLVHSEGDQPWDFFARNDAKAETPVLWQTHAKSWLIGKDSDAGRDWGQVEQGTTEYEMDGWCPDSMDMSLSELREFVMNREAWHSAIHRVVKTRTRLSDWTELKVTSVLIDNSPRVFAYGTIIDFTITPLPMESITEDEQKFNAEISWGRFHRL